MAVAAPLPLFVALAKGDTRDMHEAMLSSLDRRKAPYQLAGDVWKRVVGDKAADYDSFTRYVADRDGSGRRRFSGIVLPQAEMGIATFNLVQTAMVGDLPVLLWSDGGFRRVKGLEAIPEGTYKRAARALV